MAKVLVYRIEVVVNPATVNVSDILKALAPFGKAEIVGSAMRKE